MDDNQNNNNLLSKLSFLYLIFVGFIVLTAMLLPILISVLVKNINTKLYSIHCLIMRFTFRLFIMLTPLKIKINNIEVLEKNLNTQTVLMANHRSPIDLFILLSIILKLKVVGDKKLFKIPLIGQVLSISGHFKLDKENLKKLKSEENKIKKSISDSDIVLFFPEMKMCEAGLVGTQKFRLTAFKIAKEAESIVLPVVISGTDKLWAKDSTYVNFKNTITIDFLPPILFEDHDSISETAKSCQLMISNSLGHQDV